ncbi:hypothetical protein HMPREF9622_02868 [Cutibacterium modestum HL037PA3]|uniref:Uncharacterized protein n=1 Tax=Cutibacterium modestum HL044PA1 TaxID=765109 RepID=A0ABN0C4K9_9ACTN|nr:hypothetical protein HMPREF9621_02674 [Cutibacterium modestum HL037PA2]EFS92135.1 hypothetical protein HMPREF9607_01764 [Cutibacterium modestum HL044PA1]EFT14101.1 hypothetical protein HMPREF9622_02868 [Cutibacterium modestum HL037PA3]
MTSGSPVPSNPTSSWRTSHTSSTQTSCPDTPRNYYKKLG